MLEEFLKEQMASDQALKKFWDERNFILFGKRCENFSLAKMELSESEKEHILTLIQSPDFEKKMDELAQKFF